MTPSDAINASVSGASACRAPSAADTEIVTDRDGLTRNLNGRGIDVRQSDTSTVMP